VDDDPQVREVVRVNLEMEGYTVREAANADEGLAAVEDDAPDLILLDVMMPQVDGWEMLQKVQERHGIGSIPVVMFSGQLEHSAEREAAERGAQGFVGKPFDLRALIEQTKQIVPA
jgi:CheY-like chemotaxis protein